jgi:hypothetical protein
MTLMLEPANQSPEPKVVQSSFYEQYHPELTQLFDVLNLPPSDAISLETAVSVTQPWVKGDHGYDSYDFQLTAEQKEVLPNLYEKYDMVKPHDLPAGHYDQLLVFGANHFGNIKRLPFLRTTLESGGVTTDRVVLLGGQRKLYPDIETVDAVSSVRSLLGKGYTEEWFRRLLGKRLEDVDETDLLRMTIVDHLGPLALKDTINSDVLSDVKDDKLPIHRYEFDLNDLPLTLMHSRAVRRKDGTARHTTESCVADWIKTFDPPNGARIGFISAQPHMERMKKTVERAARDADRSDLTFIASGPGTTKETGHSIYLGEVARNLYEDKQLAKVRS